ncbi:MAG: MotA/TolQ/ExbB proton channel family protein [Verrucomicrobiales bacterium]|nr:MotA/TolQ/ExbB proton channel family protein [Verrucomicrobiales bacterium]
MKSQPHFFRFTRSARQIWSRFAWQLPLLVTGLLAFHPASLFAQEAGAEAVGEGGEAAAAHAQPESLWHTFQEGGIVMWFLLIASFTLIWLTVDLWMRTNRKRMSPPGDVAQVQDLFRTGDYVGAYQYCKNNPSPFADVSRVTLSFTGEGQEATEVAMFSELSRVNATMQTRINYLSVIGVCTPMIGLIGTVIGMKGAFKTLGTSGVGDPGKLAAAIGEVLVATASGLFIAVPAFLLFYILRNKLQGAMLVLQDSVASLFRKMPYEYLKGAHVGDEEFFAATPAWVTGTGAVEEEAAVVVAAADD